jgi:hypothetical protein
VAARIAITVRLSALLPSCWLFPCSSAPLPPGVKLATRLQYLWSLLDGIQVVMLGSYAIRLSHRYSKMLQGRGEVPQKILCLRPAWLLLPNHGRHSL